MELRKGSTVGGKRIATYDEIQKLEAIIGPGGGEPNEPILPNYKLEIMSSAGLHAKNGSFKSTFSCKVYRNSRDVTDLILADGGYSFYWERYSGDTDFDKAQDLIWKNNRLQGSIQQITSADIIPGKSTSFFCTMYNDLTQVAVLSTKK